MGGNMNKVHRRIDKIIRRLCREINERADDRQKLHTLVVRLQQVLRKAQYETQMMKVTAQHEDNPFDKIIVA
jgi:ATP phosphoribosyltransferase